MPTVRPQEGGQEPPYPAIEEVWHRLEDRSHARQYRVAPRAPFPREARIGTPIRTTMQIRFDCPTDKCVAIIEYEPLEQCDGAIECPRCRQTHSMTITPVMRNDNTPDRCAVCGGSEMFVRKDFPQAVGVTVVVVFGLAALYFFTIDVVIAWGILVTAGLVDLLIYAVIGQVTTCYACRAGYRKCNLNSAHDGFDLATAEKY